MKLMVSGISVNTILSPRIITIFSLFYTNIHTISNRPSRETNDPAHNFNTFAVTAETLLTFSCVRCSASAATAGQKYH